MPHNRVEFALERPIFWLFYQTVLDGILPEIKPLLLITLAVAQLIIEKILLPDWLLLRMRPTPRHVRPPELSPLFQRCDRHRRRCAEKMKVIRHDDISANQPAIRFAPGTQKEGNNFRPRQQWPPFVHANGDKLKDSLTSKFQRRQVRQSLATWFVD